MVFRPVERIEATNLLPLALAVNVGDRDPCIHRAIHHHLAAALWERPGPHAKLLVVLSGLNVAVLARQWAMPVRVWHLDISSDSAADAKAGSVEIVEKLID